MKIFTGGRLRGSESNGFYTRDKGWRCSSSGSRANIISVRRAIRSDSSDHSTGHVLKLRDVERLRPFEPALGEHLKHRFDALGVIQAAERDEDHSREALQVAGEHPGAAFGAEVSV